jgi:tetratricopeptide (TPR) repeat protein
MSNQSRLDALREMAARKPDDAMIQYGLGLELKKTEDLAAAADAFRAVVRIDPRYTAAYQELGSTLAASGDREEAMRVLREGIDVADKAGAMGAREHMKRILEQLEAATGEACTPQPDGFCE